MKIIVICFIVWFFFQELINGIIKCIHFIDHQTRKFLKQIRYFNFMKKEKQNIKRRNKLKYKNRKQIKYVDTAAIKFIKSIIDKNDISTIYYLNNILFNDENRAKFNSLLKLNPIKKQFISYLILEPTSKTSKSCTLYEVNLLIKNNQVTFFERNTLMRMEYFTTDVKELNQIKKWYSFKKEHDLSFQLEHGRYVKSIIYYLENMDQNNKDEYQIEGMINYLNHILKNDIKEQSALLLEVDTFFKNKRKNEPSLNGKVIANQYIEKSVQ